MPTESDSSGSVQREFGMQSGVLSVNVHGTEAERRGISIISRNFCRSGGARKLFCLQDLLCHKDTVHVSVTKTSGTEAMENSMVSAKAKIRQKRKCFRITAENEQWYLRMMILFVLGDMNKIYISYNDNSFRVLMQIMKKQGYHKKREMKMNMIEFYD